METETPDGGINCRETAPVRHFSRRFVIFYGDDFGIRWLLFGDCFAAYFSGM